MGRWLGAFTEARGWRRLLYLVAAGALSALAMAPFHVWPILFLTIPLMIAAAIPDGTEKLGARLRRGFGAGWAFGFGFHLAGLHWIAFPFLVQPEIFAWALPFAVVSMPAGLALFTGAGAALGTLISSRWLPAPFAFAIAVTLSEFARGTWATGFPWNTFGYAFAGQLPLAQVLSVIGLYGLTAVGLAAVALPLWIWPRRTGGITRPLFAVAAGVIPFVAMAVFGAVRLSAPTPGLQPDIRLRLVQPAIDQREKWRPDAQARIFERHMALTTDGGLAGITHVVWAEAAMPFQPLRSEYAMQRLAGMLPEGTHLIAGILRGEGPVTRPADRVFNSAVALDDQARVTHVYDKRHLVPFGEYLPFQDTLEALGLEQLTRQRGGFAIGDGPRPVSSVPGLPPIEFLICYEAIFPLEIARQATRAAALFNLTNDGWFGTTTGPAQHAHQTRMRAIEFGVPVVRVSNNGISFVADPYGRTRQSIALNEVGRIDTGLPMPIAQPLAARHPHAVFFACLSAVLLAGLAVGFVARRSKAS
ncbi:MAG: apolipoprotein N-acyltransferase [Pseudomonadota bacterium]